MSGNVLLLGLADALFEPVAFALIVAWLTRGGFLAVTLKRPASGQSRRSSRQQPPDPETTRSDAP